eukprot:9486694-Pyramimonas_sp.AAC.1
MSDAVQVRLKRCTRCRNEVFFKFDPYANPMQFEYVVHASFTRSPTAVQASLACIPCGPSEVLVKFECNFRMAHTRRACTSRVVQPRCNVRGPGVASATQIFARGSSWTVDTLLQTCVKPGSIQFECSSSVVQASFKYGAVVTCSVQRQIYCRSSAVHA